MTHKLSPALRHFQTLVSFAFLPQTWRKQLDVISGERLQPHFVVAFTLWLVGGVEIIQKTTGQRLDPRFWMLIAVLITAHAGVRIFRLSPLRSNLRSSKRSAAADAIVNQIVSNGFAVYHEHSEERGSDGYVIVGRGGIYAMEVKARNVFGSRTIEFRKQNELLLGGRISDCRPLKQAQAAAQKVRQRLERMLHRQTAVKPLVVFLDDWRINQSDRGRDVTVVSANELPQYLDEQQPIFSESEVAEISSCLEQETFAVAC